MFNEDEIDVISDELWKDFLNLHDKYNGKIAPQFYIYNLINFTMDIALHMCDDRKEILKLCKLAIDDAISNHESLYNFKINYVKEDKNDK